MKLSELKPPQGARKKRKRVGRGPGSGHGKTSTRGHKGQKARMKTKRWFEGGQMPLYRRLPSKGFTNIFKKEFAVINLDDLAKYDPNEEVTIQTLKEKGIISKAGKDGVKILGDGEIHIPLIFKVQAVSNSAKQKILNAGGSIEGSDK